MADDKLDEIKRLLDDNKSNVNVDYNFANGGLNMDQSINQIPKGSLTYALNAALENFDANSISYQNEPSNIPCLNENSQFFPLDYILIGTHFIQEKYKHIFFLVNPVTGASEIGYMDNNDCNYHTLVSATCLNFNIKYPIHKIVHKITNCTTEIYWTDGFNPRRYLDINNIPYKLFPGSTPCDPVYLDQVDCNQLKVQPNFKIPQLEIMDVVTGGSLLAGTYQFAIQYSDASGNPYTSYYSVTNPTPIADIQLITPNYDYPVGKSIIINVTNLDDSGQFQYYNIAVIKTINNIPSIELIGTYNIGNLVTNITYTGQSISDMDLTTSDITEKYPYYDIAQDLTAVQDVLVWDNLTSIDRINYQSIASRIGLQWETYKIPANENYADELNATNLRGYLRDEVYAFEIVFLLKNGKQTDGFHIPGRQISAYDTSYPDVPTTNADFIGNPDRIDPATGVGYSPYWKIYNTASVTSAAIGAPIGNAIPHEYGEFAYWESEEKYPCNEDLWGDLSDQPIRHHKFPDVLVSPIFENPVFQVGPGFQPVQQVNSVFPIGVKIDIQQVNGFIQTSSLTQDQKDDIVGFKIVRGDRGTNKSIVAKGILRNVGEYSRNADGFGQSFYFPNYPYNDLDEDPFINKSNNAYTTLGQQDVWFVQCTQSGKFSYTNPNNGRYELRDMVAGQNYEFCSLTRPIWLSGGANIGPANYDVWTAQNVGCGVPCSTVGARTRWTSNNAPDKSLGLALLGFGCLISPFSNTFRRVDIDKVPSGYFPNTAIATCVQKYPFQTFDEGVLPYDENMGRRSKIQCPDIGPLPSIENNPQLGYRQVFNSPETSFGQPFLGGVLKLENVIFGGGKAHFVQVRDNAKYRLLSKEAQEDALKSSFTIGGSNYTAVFTAYQAYLTIYVNGITRKNYAQSFNSVASYDYYANIENNATDYNGNLGIKQREIDLKQYLIPGVQSVGDDKNINNFQRESSVYIRTAGSENNSIMPLPYPNKTPELVDSNGVPLVSDYSRFTISETGVCNIPDKEQDIKVVSYYASMKNIAVNQWGQMYSYDTVDTGFQRIFSSGNYVRDVIFGGDTFISRFAFKTKLPFFLDNRVNAPDDSDIFYDEIGNVGYPKYWHSARSILYNYTPNNMANIISIKAHNFDCPNDPAAVPISVDGATGTWRTFYDGYFYLFAYGIPNFYCETSYNVNLRQARDNKAGDFWPHVSTGIPDDWVQQTNVPIAFDNTYYYNVTFSKQNKENSFSHLPADWSAQLCYTNYPFRAIYSDPQEQNADIRVNNWLTYAPLSLFDFPQNYGNLISLDGIQNKSVIARFENKSLLYNNLLVMDTSNPQSAYLGGTKLFGDTPPIDFAETDLGYVGSQNKFLLKIPQGQITIDAKRGQVFLIQGTQVEDLSAFGSGMNRFFTDHLAFEILRYFPKVDTDNHFNGIGLHGVYDSKFDRVIITKLDYIPIDPDVKYDAITKEFYIESNIGDFVIKTQVYLTDSDYFCNKSWTISYNVNIKRWVSFHSYIPNFYIGENNFYYSGLNGCCTDIEGDFTALVGDMSTYKTTSTTSTSSTSSTSTTTTSTTTIFIDCELEGFVVETSCDLNGNAIITVPPIPTTTVCARPLALTAYSFLFRYTLGALDVTFSDSFESACTAFPVVQNIIDTSSGFVSGQIGSVDGTVDTGKIVYNGGEGFTDCTLLPDGWYLLYTEEIVNDVYYIENGVVRSITSCCPPSTTTTTTTVYIPECCGILVASSDGIYFYDKLINPSVQLPVPGYTSTNAIAMTINKLWSIDSQINEWDITLSPFSATFNRNVAVPVGFTTSAGIVALDDLTLVGINSSASPQDIVEMDITGVTAIATVIGSLQIDRIGFGNLLYTTDGKLVVINRDSVSGDYYISQYEYSTGTLELEINVGAIALTSIFECNCIMYVADVNGNVYVVVESSYILLDEEYNMGVTPVYGATQVASCVSNSIGTTTTTTTTP